MSIDKIASSVEYQVDEQFQNWQFFKPNFGFPKWKNFRKLIFHFA